MKRWPGTGRSRRRTALREFLGQYGGLIQAGGEVQGTPDTLPESDLAEGVSIDDYSTFRATRFSEPV